MSIDIKLDRFFALVIGRKTWGFGLWFSARDPQRGSTYMVFWCFLNLFHGCRRKSDWPEANFECLRRRCDKKGHAEPLALRAKLHALKHFQRTTVCSNRLQVSCQIYNGTKWSKMVENLERRIARKHGQFQKTTVRPAMVLKLVAGDPGTKRLFENFELKIARNHKDNK